MGEPCVPWPLLHVWQVMNVQHSMLCFVVDYITPAMNGHGRGMRLGMCLVQQQYVSCAVASAACVNAKKWSVLDFITPVVHGHGRGTRLDTCLVQPHFVSCIVASAACITADKWSALHFITPVVHGHGQGTHLGTCLVQLQCVSCVVAFAACVTTNKCCVLFLISLHLLCTSMDEARTLVRALCNYSVSPMSSPLLHAWLLINVVFCWWWHNTCSARAWTRHAPWYVPCAIVVCLMCPYFVACFSVSISWVGGACTRHAAWHTASVHRVWRGLCCRRHWCWMALPKDVVRMQAVQSCDTK